MQLGAYESFVLGQEYCNAGIYLADGEGDKHGGFVDRGWRTCNATYVRSHQAPVAACAIGRAALACDT